MEGTGEWMSRTKAKRMACSWMKGLDCSKVETEAWGEYSHTDTSTVGPGPEGREENKRERCE